MSATGLYRIDERHLERVLETLKGERQKARFSRPTFRLLRGVVYAFAILWLLHWLLVIGTPLEEVLNLVAGNLGFTSWFWLTSVLSMVLIFVGVVLVVLNLPMVHVIRRQVTLAGQLESLSLVDRSPAQPFLSLEPVRGFWLKVLAGLLLSAVAVSFYFWFAGIHGLWRLLGVLVVFGGGAYLILTGRKIPLRALRYVFWGLFVSMALALVLALLPQTLTAGYGVLIGRFHTVVLMFTVPALVFVGDRALARVEEQMELAEDADRLHRSLSHRKSDAPDSGFFDLPAAEAERLARIERRVIRQSRQVAIASARSAQAAGFTIFKSPLARAQIDDLERRQRFQVESKIQDLTFEPRPEAATGDAGGRWILPIPEFELEIVYAIDESSRELEIQTVRPAAGGEPA